MHLFHRKIYFLLFGLLFLQNAEAHVCSMIFTYESPQKIEHQQPQRSSLHHFLQRYSQSSDLIWSQKFQKFVLVISLSGKSSEEGRAVEADYISYIAKGTLSFLAVPKSTHLYVRYQHKVLDFFDHFQNPFRITDYRVPRQSRLEPVISLTEFEKSQLLQYLLNIEQDAYSTLGPFRYGGGHQTEGRIDQNQCYPGHNCVSWISTAPIGVQGQKFFEVLGVPKQEQLLTHPEQWIQAVIKSERTEFLTLWTHERLEAGKEFVYKDDFSQWFSAEQDLSAQ